MNTTFQGNLDAILHGELIHFVYQKALIQTNISHQLFEYTITFVYQKALLRTFQTITSCEFSTQEHNY